MSRDNIDQDNRLDSDGYKYAPVQPLSIDTDVAEDDLNFGIEGVSGSPSPPPDPSQEGRPSSSLMHRRPTSPTGEEEDLEPTSFCQLGQMLDTSTATMGSEMVANSLTPKTSTTAGDYTPSPSLDAANSSPEQHAQDESCDDAESDVPVEFPVHSLNRLENLVNRPQWVVPVLPNGELPYLLKIAIRMAKTKEDVNNEHCQRFIKDSLYCSFSKLMGDEAVKDWKLEIQKAIYNCTMKVLKLCVLKLDQDCLPLLDILAMVVDPSVRFHTFNATRVSELIPAPPGGDAAADAKTVLAAAHWPGGGQLPKGWLLDFLNQFALLGGFEKWKARFEGSTQLNIQTLAALVKPFGLCCHYLRQETVITYLMPAVHIAFNFLQNLSDDALKKECGRIEGRENLLSSIVYCLRAIVARVPEPANEKLLHELQNYRLKALLRLLKVSSFGGKMNALNEINRLCAACGTGGTFNSVDLEEEGLTVDQLISWIQNSDLLGVLLHENLHQPLYVERLEKIIRFMTRENALTMKDLDSLWAAQQGKHDAIVKNMHNLLAKLAWDFGPQQLDYLFQCFQRSWRGASRKEREQLLELMGRMAEDDKEGVMAGKVLEVLWALAHSPDLPSEIVDLALAAHVKILDYGCSADRDRLKIHFLEKCVAEIFAEEEVAIPADANNTAQSAAANQPVYPTDSIGRTFTRKQKLSWVVPAICQIREICKLYNESPPNLTGYASNRLHPHYTYRHEVLGYLHTKFALVIEVTNNLLSYMRRAREIARRDGIQDPAKLIIDGRYPHPQQLNERLSFLRFLLTDGQMWLCEPQPNHIWEALVVNGLFASDRDIAFRWFAKLMGDEPDLDPETMKPFFEQQILQLDVLMLTEHGLRCFERFFRAVNAKEERLIIKRRNNILLNDYELLGIDYLWRIILFGGEDVARQAIFILRDIYSNPSPKMQYNLVSLHSDLLTNCRDHLKASFDTLSLLEKDKDSLNRIRQNTTKMARTLRTLYEYVAAYDQVYPEERARQPLARAYHGEDILVVVRLSSSQGRPHEDLELWTHSNQTVCALRRQIMSRLSLPANVKLELFLNGDVLAPQQYDVKVLGELSTAAISGGKMALTAKVTQLGYNGQTGSTSAAAPSHGVSSSPESSSDSSPLASPGAHDPPSSVEKAEVEAMLPGVMLAEQPHDLQKLFQYADIGAKMSVDDLQDIVWAIIRQIPVCRAICEQICAICRDPQKPSAYDKAPCLESLYFTDSPSEVLYNLQVTYCLLMPTHNALQSEVATELRQNFFVSGGAQLCLAMLVRNNFMPQADTAIRWQALVWVLMLTKFSLLTVACAKACRTSDSRLDQAITSSCLQADTVIKSVASALGRSFASTQILTNVVPEACHVHSVIRLVWAAASGSRSIYTAPLEEIHKAHSRPSTPGTKLDPLDLQMVSLGMDVMTLCFFLAPDVLRDLWMNPSAHWRQFLIDMLFVQDENVRQRATEKLFCIASQHGADGSQGVGVLLDALLAILNDGRTASEHYFTLLARLIHWASLHGLEVPNKDRLLEQEIGFLKRAKEHTSSHFESYPDETLLEGHLVLTTELIKSLGTAEKQRIGSTAEPAGCGLIRELVDDFVLPASRMYVLMRRQTGSKALSTGLQRSATDMPLAKACDSTSAVSSTETQSSTVDEVTVVGLPRSQTASAMVSGQCVPVCGSGRTTAATYDLLVALCTHCLPNLKLLVELLCEMFYEDPSQSINEWEYLPPIGLRPSNGYVGLKNGGATCYMNSVLQQLFMLEHFRDGVLSVEAGAIQTGDEGSDGEDISTASNAPSTTADSQSQGSKVPYHLSIVRNLQLIFGHLMASQLQFYVPRKFWRQFRFAGEPINLREQHDAVEFVDHVIDSVDEACKALGRPALSQSTIAGLYADQKICKDCPHRYSKDAPFLVLSVDIRNVGNLLAALEDHVRGELLEGPDAYFCDNCQTKVDAVKRLCIKKLPRILVFQLKRFDYDWEREQAVKFNDYFEFPRELDMEPYTIRGLAKKQDEFVALDPEADDSSTPTRYALTGVVVHSGQASGGHYYSFIRRRTASDGQVKWFKFDDGDVSEADLEGNDEELRNQCFGGEYMGEVYDHMAKRMAMRRQKRWWNAYMLVYEQLPGTANASAADSVSVSAQLSQMSISTRLREMPGGVERAVRLQNMRALHQRQQFSAEYFNFVRRLATANLPAQSPQVVPAQASEEMADIAVLTLQLLSKFLFMTGLHAKKVLRGPSNEWVDILAAWFAFSPAARRWFARTQIILQPQRLPKYMLECQSQDVRAIFCRIMAYLVYRSQDDLVSTIDPQDSSSRSVSEILLNMVLSLLDREVADWGRHLQQYFSFFHFYAGLGANQRLQLLNANVPYKLMCLAVEQGPGPPVRYQYPDFTKLFATVSLLSRSCDTSKLCQTQTGEPVVKGSNPYAEGGNLMQLPAPVISMLLEPKHSYLKKIIEDSLRLDDNLKLLQFLCWENQKFSYVITNVLFYQLWHAVIQEVRPVLDILHQILMIQDSWQPLRILGSLKGVSIEGGGSLEPVGGTAVPGPGSGGGGGASGECVGLFDLLIRSRVSSPRRCYFIIKALTNLFAHCPQAAEILSKSGNMKRHWHEAIKWLHEEMEQRRPYPSFSYTNWSPVQTNEASNAYYLERSNSARLTLEKAKELLRDYCGEESEAEEGGGSDMESANLSDEDPRRRAGGTVTGTTDPPPPPETEGPGHRVWLKNQKPWDETAWSNRLTAPQSGDEPEPCPPDEGGPTADGGSSVSEPESHSCTPPPPYEAVVDTPQDPPADTDSGGRPPPMTSDL